jgi:hypothetical protein
MGFKQKLVYMALGGLIIVIGIMIGQGLQNTNGNEAVAQWGKSHPKYQFYPVKTSNDLLVGYLLNTESGDLQKVVEFDKDGSMLGLQILSAMTGKDFTTLQNEGYELFEKSLMKDGGQGWLMPPHKQLEAVKQKETLDEARKRMEGQSAPPIKPTTRPDHVRPDRVKELLESQR